MSVVFFFLIEPSEPKSMVKRNGVTFFRPLTFCHSSLTHTSLLPLSLFSPLLSSLPPSLIGLWDRGRGEGAESSPLSSLPRAVRACPLGRGTFSSPLLPPSPFPPPPLGRLLLRHWWTMRFQKMGFWRGVNRFDMKSKSELVSHFRKRVSPTF